MLFPRKPNAPSQSQSQQHTISPDKGRTDDLHSDDEDNEEAEICVDETDDVTPDVSSAMELKDIVETGKRIKKTSNKKKLKTLLSKKKIK